MSEAGAGLFRMRSPAATLAALALLAPCVAAAQAAATYLKPLTKADGEAIEQALRGAPEFPALPTVSGVAAALESSDPAVQAKADATLSAAAIALAAAENGAPRNPAAIDPDWLLRDAYDAQADFAAARAQGRIVVWAASLPRKDPAYLGLVAAWKSYDAVRAKGGWATIPPGAELKAKAKGGRVDKLRSRLADEGYAASGKPGDPFDDDLAAAVADFQIRHGLKATGAVNEETLDALNVPVETRLATLSANLERARWLPDQFPADRVEANVGAAEVVLFRGGAPTLPMRAVVGDVKHRTPIFVARVMAVVFNPPWVVPPDIAKAELFPKAHRSPGYFARNDMYVSNGQIIQRAGPKSSLGRLKFDMDDPYAIYMHDTPARSLFALDYRWKSHGCMRLQSPKDMAVALLGPQKWDEDAVQAAIDAHTTKRVGLTPRLPVYVVYRTAEAPSGAPAVFRPDVYGWDTKLMDAIKKS